MQYFTLPRVFRTESMRIHTAWTPCGSAQTTHQSTQLAAQKTSYNWSDFIVIYILFIFLLLYIITLNIYYKLDYLIISLRGSYQRESPQERAVVLVFGR